MSDERWPYGTVVGPKDQPSSRLRIMVVGYTENEIKMITLADPDDRLFASLDGHYAFGRVWGWQIWLTPHWTPVDD